MFSFIEYYLSPCYDRNKYDVAKDFGYRSCLLCDSRYVFSMKTEFYKSVCGQCYSKNDKLRIYYEGKIDAASKLHPRCITSSSAF